MKVFSVNLPEALAEWLLGKAKLTRRSRSDVVREALELKRNGNRTPAGKRRLTMAEAMADLRGSITGPTDLSTNALLSPW